MSKVIIIGKGPAGISCGLYVKRAGMDVTIIGKGVGSLEKAESIENYYGLEKPISGKELASIGIRQAEALGITVIDDEIVGLDYGSPWTVQGKDRDYEGDVIVLATGSSRKSLRIPGIDELTGRGVSYCATCDGFFYRGKRTAVIGDGEFAIHEAMVLSNTSETVTIFTNGKELQGEAPENIQVVQTPLKKILGEEKVEGILLEDETTVPLEGVFMALGVAGSTDFAQKIGANISDGKIAVDENMATNVPGLYAIGDSVGGLLQVAKAVSDGAIAATAIGKYLRSLKG